MRRREFIALMGASVAWPFAALAQEPGRTYRLGALWGGQRGVDDSINVSLRSAFLDPARRAGFIEGQNLTVDDRVLRARFLSLLGMGGQLGRELINQQPQ